MTWFMRGGKKSTARRASISNSSEGRKLWKVRQVTFFKAFDFRFSRDRQTECFVYVSWHAIRPNSMSDWNPFPHRTRWFAGCRCRLYAAAAAVFKIAHWIHHWIHIRVECCVLLCLQWWTEQQQRSNLQAKRNFWSELMTVLKCVCFDEFPSLQAVT